MIKSSARLAGFLARDVLAVGDGHDPLRSGLPRLSGSDEEAAEIANQYATSLLLIGSEATRRQFFAAEHEVVHFAGHSVADLEFPMFSRILLAPDPAHDGAVLAGEIIAHRFERTKVIVLASCEGAAGSLVDGEGVLSLSRMFLNAGIPVVV
jgi:CHAT domain-containing protein